MNTEEQLILLNEIKGELIAIEHNERLSVCEVALRLTGKIDLLKNQMLMGVTKYDAEDMVDFATDQFNRGIEPNDESLSKWLIYC